MIEELKSNIGYLLSRTESRAAPSYFLLQHIYTLPYIHLYLNKNLTETPGHNSGWAETPRTDRGSGVDTIQETPTPGTKRRSRWDETPGATPAAATPTPSHATPSHATPSHATPSHATPTPHTPVFTPGGVSMTSEYVFLLRFPVNILLMLYNFSSQLR